MKIITDDRCLGYSRRGHPERPQRITRTIEKLRAQVDLPMTWVQPSSVTDDALVRAHSRQHLEELAHPLTDFDSDTPAYPEIDEHARRSVSGAIDAMNLSRAGEKAFSLLRPPGHHATAHRAMGFCYLNSVAIAALEAHAAGAGRVAVFDFDVHHGNGTESILLDRPDCGFYSIHQYPAYPGSGAHPIRNCWNFPVPPGATRALYRESISQALEQMAGFKPELIGISAGFDAFRGDPLSDEPLEAEDFFWIGEQLSKTGVPSFSVLEGGYSHELPELILAFLKGWTR